MATGELPLEAEARLNALHSRTPVRSHLDILYGDTHVGAESFVDLYFRCLERTGTMLTPFAVFQRFQTRHDLLRYFLATLELPGGRAECGAYRGATALMLCNAWHSRHGDFTGSGFYLIDSFSGTGVSTVHDLIPVRDARGGTHMSPFFPPGKTDVTADAVRGHFHDFPGAAICAGWIPAVFAQLPEQPWAFVHIDLTLYEATLAALEYFYPRLTSGGVIICDGSVFCPGVQQALDEFSASHGLAYALLGYREAVFLKT
jgi:hypothetical protein